jgi:predicted RNase H-like nuclease
MHDVGVDLAWGQSGTTGLAVLDETGTLLDVTERRSDQAIITWLEPWVSDACLVAIDAPLIVNNPTGNRQCERLIARHFGRYQAYCHSANTSNPHFAGGTRALRIARALDLDVDPVSSAPRRAVEVYPHPAIVVLFGLPRILRYKAKPGRDLVLLRSELLRLIELLDGLSQAEVPMYVGQNDDLQRIRRAVGSARRKADLARVEDSIDAVVCAYVAAYATREQASVRVMGDLASGYILTPVTPEIGRAFDSTDPSSRRTAVRSRGNVPAGHAS